MAPARIVCPSCNAGLRLAAALPAGKKIKCPKCQKSFAPTPEEEPKEVVEAIDEPAAADTEQDQPKPAKTKKKALAKSSNALLLIIGGVVVAGVVGLVALGGALWAFGVFKKAPDKSLVKNDPNVKPPPGGGDGPDGGPPAGGNWKPTTFADLKCKLSFPAEPTKILEDKDLVTYLAKDFNTGFTLTVTSIPDYKKNLNVKELLEDEAAMFKAVRSKKNVTIKGHPGIEIVCETIFVNNTPENLDYIRYFVVNNREYRLTVMTGIKNTSRKDVDRFFDSFQLLD